MNQQRTIIVFEPVSTITHLYFHSDIVATDAVMLGPTAQSIFTLHGWGPTSRRRMHRNQDAEYLISLATGRYFRK